MQHAHPFADFAVGTEAHSVERAERGVERFRVHEHCDGNPRPRFLFARERHRVAAVKRAFAVVVVGCCGIVAIAVHAKVQLLFEALDHRAVVRVVEGQPRASGVRDAHVLGRVAAQIVVVVQVHDTVVFFRHSPHQHVRVVGAAVVHHDELPVGQGLRLQRPDGVLDVLGAVVGGHHHRHRGHADDVSRVQHNRRDGVTWRCGRCLVVWVCW